MSKIKLDIKYYDDIIRLIIDEVFLINIFDQGLCITQNINQTSNYSIFIQKNKFTHFHLENEFSFVTKNINDIFDIKTTIIDNKLSLANNNQIVNNVCNLCKKLNTLKFNKNNIKINIDKKIDFLNDNSFETLISSKFNGVVFRTNKFGFNIYINLIYK
jgi:hypothetical protein